MRQQLARILIFSFFILQFFIAGSHAAPVNQSITLQPGWNAIYLEVNPAVSDPATVFTGITDLLSVWRWNPNTSTVEFIQNPDSMVPQQEQMLSWFPGNPVTTNLHAIHGGHAYLVNLGGSTNQNLVVNGEPNILTRDWKPNSFNFVGFPQVSGQEYLFADFFSSAPALADQDIYVLDAGAWTKVSNPSAQMIKSEGFWIYCKGSSQFSGPLSVQLEQSTGLIYGTVLQEQDLLINNNSTAPLALTLSLTNPAVPLLYWEFDPENEVAGWMPMPSGSITIPAGESQRIRLGVRRAGLTEDIAYLSNLKISNGTGLELLIPTSVTGIDFHGLWVGYATVNQVSEPRVEVDPAKLPKTGSEFSFRLIVHVDAANNARLLKEVIQLWQDGSWIPDPEEYGKLIPDPANPGHFVLLSDAYYVGSYSGAALRNGQPVGRRISAPNFEFATPVSAAGESTFTPTGYLQFDLSLAKDNPLNPFVHRYHPDHLLPSTGTEPAEKIFDIGRSIKLQFSDVDSEDRLITGVPTLGWASSEIGGIYSETITGLHKDNLHTGGTFVLRKVSDITQLIGL